MAVLAIVLGTCLLLTVLGASVYFLFFLRSGDKVGGTNERRRPQQRRVENRGRERHRRLPRRRRGADDDEVLSDEAADDDEDANVDDFIEEEHVEADGLGLRARRVREYDEKRRQRDAEREAQEEKASAERLRKAEERRRQEEEEAQKWAEFITVEETGELKETNEEDLLQAFVNAIQSRKIVILEELAIEFEIRTQDVIHRIESLEATGRLTGVMDDRGKYIYIAEAEMKGLAEYIETRGRVSIRELAEVSHRFVDLESKS